MRGPRRLRLVRLPSGLYVLSFERCSAVSASTIPNVVADGAESMTTTRRDLHVLG